MCDDLRGFYNAFCVAFLRDFSDVFGPEVYHYCMDFERWICRGGGLSYWITHFIYNPTYVDNFPLVYEAFSVRTLEMLFNSGEGRSRKAIFRQVPVFYNNYYFAGAGRCEIVCRQCLRGGWGSNIATRARISTY